MEKTNKLKAIKTRKEILRFIDEEMRRYLIDEEKDRRKKNYSEALICQNYFFALFFLRERILRKNLDVNKEIKRILKQRGGLDSPKIRR